MSHIGESAREIHLEPGEVWFGGGMVCVRTLLGSCVSVTLWHPRLKIGGMCHFMLPERMPGGDSELNGKYAEEAFLIMDKEIRRAGTHPADYQAKIFGGGNMFPKVDSSVQGDVGRRNIDIARHLLTRRGINVQVQHVGGSGHRKLVFELWSGDVWVRFQEVRPMAETQ